jgi:hypothetical protein
VAGGPNAALVNSVGLSLTQRRSGNEVPGPLPILGAGVAFGLSRKGNPRSIRLSLAGEAFLPIHSGQRRRRDSKLGKG